MQHYLASNRLLVNYNWAKSYTSLVNLGLILYGLAAALAFLPLYESNFYNNYELRNFIRFTGLGISLSDSVLIPALILLSYKIVEGVSGLKNRLLVVILLVIPITATLAFYSIGLGGPESVARTIRLSVYLLTGYLVLNNSTLKAFWYGYAAMVPIQLIAIGMQMAQSKQLIGLTVNQNIVAAYFLTVVMIATYLYLKTNPSKNEKTFLLIAMSVSIVALILTVSRGNILGLVTLLLVVIFIAPNFVKTYYPYLLAAPAIAILLLAFLAPARIDTLLHLQSLQERGVLNKIDSFSAGRITSAEGFLYTLSRDQTFARGYGPAGFTVKTGRAPAHNIYLQFIAEYGITAALLITTLLFYLGYKNKLLLLPILITGIFSYLTFFAEGSFIAYTLIGVTLANER